MCLDLEVELPIEASSGKVGARRLSHEIGLRVSGYHGKDGRRRFHFARGKECSCSLLGEGFQIRAREWPLEPDAGVALSRAMSLIAAAVPSFTVHSVWAGSEDEPAHSNITLTQLLEELRGNRLQAHSVRNVRSAG